MYLPRKRICKGSASSLLQLCHNSGAIIDGMASERGKKLKHFTCDVWLSPLCMPILLVASHSFQKPHCFLLYTQVDLESQTTKS